MRQSKQTIISRWWGAAFALLVGVLLPQAAYAAATDTFAVEGVLRDVNGVGVDGKFNLKFGIYANKLGGVAVWQEGPLVVDVKGGYFWTALGKTTPITAVVLASLNPAWLGITVESDAELDRQTLFSVASALRTEMAEAMDCSGCVPKAAFGAKSVTTNAIADGAVDTNKANFKYAGSASKGGAASDVACSGCVQGGEIDKATTLTLGNANAGTLALKTLTATTMKVAGSSVCTTAGNCKDSLANGTYACKKGETLFWDGAKWYCKLPIVVGTSLSDIAPCPKDQVLSYDGAAWKCLVDVDSLDKIVCNATETPLKQVDGTWKCAYLVAPGSPAQPCVGAYKSLEWNGKDWVCVNVLATGLSGGKYNGYEVTDNWKDAWDGNQRGAMTWTNAKATCESLGGRLPTTTELYRASAVGTGQVGSPAATNYVWALNPRSPSNVMIVRLSDGDGAVTRSPIRGLSGAFGQKCRIPKRLAAINAMATPARNALL